MNKQQILANMQTLYRRLSLKASDLALTSEASMVLLGLKDSCESIEALLSTKVWVKLMNRGINAHHNHTYPTIPISDLKIDIRLDPKMFELEKVMVDSVMIIHPHRLLDIKQRHVQTHGQDDANVADIKLLNTLLIKRK